MCLKSAHARIEIPELEFEFNADGKKHIDSIYNHIAQVCGRRGTGGGAGQGEEYGGKGPGGGGRGPRGGVRWDRVLVGAKQAGVGAGQTDGGSGSTCAIKKRFRPLTPAQPVIGPEGGTGVGGKQGPGGGVRGR